MTLNEYQLKARETATYPKEYADEYLDLGLNGEVGEVCDKVKKLIRDNGISPYVTEPTKIPLDKREDIALELGDLCWYIANYYYEQDICLGNRITLHADDELVSEIDDCKQTCVHLTAAVFELVEDIKENNFTDAMNCIGCIAQKFLGFKLSYVLERNIEKLASRKERGVINGSGDNR